MLTRSKYYCSTVQYMYLVQQLVDSEVVLHSTILMLLHCGFELSCSFFVDASKLLDGRYPAYFQVISTIFFTKYFHRHGRITKLYMYMYIPIYEIVLTIFSVILTLWNVENSIPTLNPDFRSEIMPDFLWKVGQTNYDMLSWIKWKYYRTYSQLI